MPPGNSPQKLQAAGRVTDLDGFLADVAAREAQMATGMPGGIGLPHARSEHVTVPSLGLARVPAGVDFGAPDGPATLVFLIAAPAGGGSEHLTILAALARRLVRPAFRQTIIDAPDAASVASYVQGEVGGQMKFVAVTSCPTGIAHTYMAAENLEQAGKAAGHDVQVETQGSAGTVPLSDDVIAAADGVIYAADLEVKGKGRFAGKPFVDVGVKKAVHDGPGVIAAAVAAVENAPKAGTPEAAAAAAAAPAPSSSCHPRGRSRHPGAPVADDRRVVHDPVRRRGRHAHGARLHVRRRRGRHQALRRRRIEGVTYHGHRRQPAGGLPKGRSFDTLLAAGRFRRHPVLLGKVAFFMLVPVLSGYHRVRDRGPPRPGSRHRRRPARRLLGAGFLGGLVSGFAAGGIAYCMTRLKVPKGVRGVMPVVVIPLVSVIVVGLFMIFVVGKPIAAATTALTDWLTGLSGSTAHPARRHPGPDDGLRPGWADQQGRLHVRRGGSDDRHRRGERPQPACRSWPP